ncbi:hypothetical protein KVM30_01735 [Helicobacter pylori]|uniref:hypothetical protein n=1 Tax=Helicobacter pylori TaxID=210 RepID=UPI00165A8677|nr:hypothetical protein [Helicobacter pylori]WQS44150.1 hypothetical protein KVC65_06115 [Helicobacter pylori]WQW79752.1 hypothetical protein KVM30_01735 [Helicobacter pylori]WQY76723.1 hypothetical protein E5L52_06315 [Helicobacter pylori]WQZ75865.1 hypothetical protein KVJ64_06185 [Helicobacter pylori]
MNTKGKNKNASHLTHEMKNKHGDLAEASKRAEMQPILEALYYVAKEESEGYKKAAEGYKKAAEGYKQVLEAKEKADKILNTLKAISHDNNIIDIEPED